MKITTVRLQKIEPPTVLKEEFDEVQLEKAAQLILDMEGIVTPPILRRIGPEAYTILDGHFQYYAALKAMELNQRKNKTTNAYIVESEDEMPFYEQQIELFRQQQSVPTQAASKEPPPLAEPTPEEASKEPSPLAKPAQEEALKEPTLLAEPEPVTTLSDTSNEKAAINEVGYFATLEKTVNTLVAKNDTLEKTITQLVKENGKVLHNTVEAIKGLIGEQFQEIRHKIKQEVGEEIQGLSKKIEELQPALSGMPQIKEDKPVTPQQTSEIASTPETTLFEEAKIVSTEQKFLDEVNTLPERELAVKLGRLLEMVGIKKKMEDVIIRIENERQKRPFISTENMITRLKGSGLGKQRLEKLLKLWS
jgi:regulator of replication initiation timing